MMIAPVPQISSFVAMMSGHGEMHDGIPTVVDFLRHKTQATYTPSGGCRYTSGTRRVHCLGVDTSQAKDKICKRLFCHGRLVADMLRGYVPGGWVRDIEFESLRRMPSEFVGRSGNRRFGDILCLTSLDDGRQVMVLIEIQSGVDPNMAARMGAYTCMVYDSLIPAARGPGGRYPALLPIVVHTGKEAWNAGADLRRLVDPVAGLDDYVAGPRYVRLDLCAAAPDDPLKDRLGVLARLTGGSSLPEMVAVLSTAAGWLRRNGDGVDDAEDRSLYGAYLDWVKVLLPGLGMPVPESDAELLLDWRELMDGLTVLEARSREWPREWLAQGRAEGLEQG